MARPAAIIHVAYSVSRRRDGDTSYWAKAAVTDEGFAGYNTVRSGIGDSAAEAIDNAVNYVLETYHRDGIPAPGSVVKYGRVPRVDIQNVSFIGRK